MAEYSKGIGTVVRDIRTLHSFYSIKITATKVIAEKIERLLPSL